MHSKAANLIISHSNSTITTVIISNNSNTSSIRSSSSITNSSTASRISNTTNRTADSTPTSNNSIITRILGIDKIHHNRNNKIFTTSHNRISISNILIIKVNFITNSNSRDHSSNNSNTPTVASIMLQ